ncbi:MAG TPA: methyltransferase [Streptosporangiaceae bacterium]
MNYAASAPTSANTATALENGIAYRRFHDAVARAQLVAWLPPRRQLLVDISGPRADSAELAAHAGHTVLRVVDDVRSVPARTGDGQPRRDPRRSGGTAPPGQGQLRTLVGDTSTLAFLPDGCADGVIAGDRALSTHLGAESMVAAIARVLRPAGRVLACVDSLVLGMAVLAGQHHWPHLADLPRAEVVLIPWPDGTITRCYGPDQLSELFTGAGLAVSWMRPLTVFSESLVTRVLSQDPDCMPRLVRAELGAQTDEAFGAELVVSARKL